MAGGDAAEAIIEAAGREKADAIVVGRRGRGRLAGLLLGSVEVMTLRCKRVPHPKQVPSVHVGK